jgi:NitT/TauT family transport system permease protein
MTIQPKAQQKFQLSELWNAFTNTALWPTSIFVLFILAWQFYVRSSGTLKLILPAPSDILVNMWQQRDLLLENAWPTALQCLLGFALACLGGIALAIVLTQFTTIRRGFYPLIVAIALIPKISVAPLFALWFGTGTVSRVSLVFFITFFPMVISPATGLMSVDPALQRMALAFGATKGQIFRTLQIPSALPYIFDGMKVAISLAVIGIIVAEFVTSDRGLGYVIIFSTGMMDTATMMSAIITISVMGLAFYYAVEMLGRTAIYWKR